MQKSKKIIFLKILLLILVIILAALLYYKNMRVKVDFSLKGPDEITLEVGKNYTDPGVIAKIDGKNFNDNVSVKSNLDFNKLGTYYTTYHLKVSFLKVDETIKRKIKVIDNIKPVLTVNSDDEVIINRGDELIMPTIEAYDNVDDIITDKIKIDSNVDTKKEGIYKIKYSVSDSSGNDAEKIITVKVEDKFKNSYIEVSISTQKLYYYEKGELKLTSDVVTGINNGTPTGNYKVLSKSRNVNLKGANYTSFVNYWIAFLGSSYGLHDASWRSTFGGTIYKYNGSHGCVNMPYNKVKQLYEMVEIGTPVYIKH